jgi:hypothetical protein
MNENGIGLLTSLPSEEPVALLLLVATAIILFGSFFRTAPEELPWVKNIIASGVRAMIFVGLVIGGYVFVKSNIKSFEVIHQSFTGENSISWFKWKRAVKTWGGWIIQRELIVNHFIETESLATLPVVDPAAPLLYLTSKVRQQIPQNSITRFRGKVDLTSGKQEDPDGFNGYYVQANFVYDVVNQSDLAVETEFLFPLETYPTTYEKFHLYLDQKEFTSVIVTTDGLRWSIAMAPRKKIVISISYSAKGMNGYTYTLPESREVRDFILTISSDRPDVYASVSPTGETIQHAVDVSPAGMFISTARIDQAVVAPTIGVSFVETTLPYAPYDLALHLLRFMPRSSIFLAVVCAITLLISGAPFGLRELTLFLSLSWAHIFSSILICWLFQDPKNGLLCSAAFFTILQYYVLRGAGLSWFARVGMLSWMFFFAGIYPLSGQRVETYPVNQYDSLILVGILIYAFSYSLSQRVNRPLAKVSRRSSL